MRYYRPHWSLQAPLTPALNSTSKLGGRPLGFPAHLWPVCSECGQAMSFLGQFSHGIHLPRIPARHSLFLFKCERESICDFWDPIAGANACITLAHTGLSAAFTPPPAGSDVPSLLELWVDRWEAADDGIPELLEAHFYDERFESLPETVQSPHGFKPGAATKAGGLPYWTSNGLTPIPASAEPLGRLLLQLDHWLELADTAQALQARISLLPEHGPGSVLRDGQRIDIANFCCDGIAYVMDRQPEAESPDFYFMILR